MDPCQIPSTAVGSFLDNESLRIGISLRIGLRVCEPHRCRCGKEVDAHALHPLSCCFSAGRFPRHVALNDGLKRALDSAGIPSVLEPVGLDRGDGKRPDGVTVFPFRNGKSLAWDATCSDTVGPSAICTSAVNPGHAARAAEEAKRRKYADLSDRFIFVPVAVETSGVIGPAGFSLLKDIGRRIATLTSDPRQGEYLFQRISLAIIRGNSYAISSAARNLITAL